MALQEFLKIAGGKEIDIRSISASEALDAVKQTGDALRFVHKSIFQHQHTVTIELTAEQLKHINNTCGYNLKTNGEN